MNLLLPMAPQYQSRDDLHTTTQNLADEPTLANGTPSTRAEMPWIPLHKTWQMNLLWLIDPSGTRPEMTYIPLHKTWQMNPLLLMDTPSNRGEMPCKPIHQTWQMNLCWLIDHPTESRLDALNTATQNLADEPTLANGPPLQYSYSKLGRWTYFGRWTHFGFYKKRWEFPLISE